MEKYFVLMDGKINIVKMVIFPKAICRFSAILTKIPIIFVIEIEQKNPKIWMEPQKDLESQTALRKKNKFKDIMHLDFKPYLISTVSPSISHEVMGPDAMVLVFWMLSFKPTFSHSSFTFMKRLFSSSSLSALRVVSSAYLRSLIFLPAILIPAYFSSSPAFLMMYSAYKLNKQGDNIQPWCTPFPIWKQSVVPCPVLTVASWSAYRFLHMGQVVGYSHLFQNFPHFIMIHTVKGFGIINKVEIDVFLEISCFFNDQVDVGNLISGSSAFSKTSLNIWKSTVHVLLKPDLENFEHYFTSV